MFHGGSINDNMMLLLQIIYVLVIMIFVLVQLLNSDPKDPVEWALCLAVSIAWPIFLLAALLGFFGEKFFDWWDKRGSDGVR